MPVRVALDLDTTRARASAEDLGKTIAASMQNAGEVANKSLALDTAVEAWKKLEAQAEESLKRIREEAAKTAGTNPTPTPDPTKSGGGKGKTEDKLDAFLEKAKIDDLVGAFGDLKDVFEKTAGSIGGLSEEAVEASIKVADIAEKGAMIGATFGPLGTIVGFTLGAALGVVTEKADRLTAKVTALKEATDEVRESWRAYADETRKAGEVSADSLQEAVRASSALIQKQNEFTRSTNLALYEERWWGITDAQESVLDGAGKVLLLNQRIANDRSLARLETALKGIAGLWEEQARATADYQKALGLLGKERSVEELAQEFGDAQDAVHDAEQELLALQKTLREPVEGGVLGALKAIDGYLSDLPAKLAKLEAARDEALAAGEAFVAADAEAKEKRKEAAKDRKKEAAEAIQDQLDNEYQLWLEGELRRLALLDETRQAENLATETARAEQLAALWDHLNREEELRAANSNRRIEREQAEAEERKRQMSEEAENFERLLAPVGRLADSVLGTITENIEANRRALEGLGVAVRKAIGDELKALAKKLGVKALEETAMGLAALFVNPPEAGTHFAAAAAFTAAAVAAGAGGALLSRGASASSPPAAASSSGSSGGSSPSLGRSADRAGVTQTGTTIVQLSGNLFLDGDDRALAKAGHRLAGALGAAHLDRRLDDGARRAS